MGKRRAFGSVYHRCKYFFNLAHNIFPVGAGTILGLKSPNPPPTLRYIFRNNQFGVELELDRSLELWQALEIFQDSCEILARGGFDFKHRRMSELTPHIDDTNSRWDFYFICIHVGFGREKLGVLSSRIHHSIFLDKNLEGSVRKTQT